MNLNLNTSLRAVADLAFPRCCVACGRDLLLHEKLLCTPCAADLPLTFYWQQRDNPMALRFNERIRDDAPFAFPFGHAAALLFYGAASPYRNIPQALKYRRNLRAGRYFAVMLGRLLAASPLFSDVDLVLPVPLHWSRRWRRGYNQAGVIARGVAKALPAARLDTRILRRRRRTGTQTRLQGAARAENVSGAFRLCRPGRLGDCRHILIVDDVFTTGATLAACHRALRVACGPGVRISVATLACVR